MFLLRDMVNIFQVKSEIPVAKYIYPIRPMSLCVLIPNPTGWIMYYTWYEVEILIKVATKCQTFDQYNQRDPVILPIHSKFFSCADFAMDTDCVYSKNE